MQTDYAREIEREGYLMLPGVFTEPEVARIASEIDTSIREDANHASALARGDIIVAARNILEIYPPACELWQRSPLTAVLRSSLGSEYGLMRGLYFDKPPGKSWALPWHQDRAIAVKQNRLPSSIFGKPTTKSGVPHVESPLRLSKRILMARIHLDAMVQENGPLQVMPGSHHDDVDTSQLAGVTLFAKPGDVLLMSPLLYHRSSESAPGCQLHRRILQLEFAGSPLLPDGYQWHTYIPYTLSS